MERAELIPLTNSNCTEVIHINNTEFSLGRALTNSYTFKELCISRCHCIFKHDGTRWIIIDKSSNGTTINSEVIPKHSGFPIQHNDIIELTDTIKYRFRCSPGTDDHCSMKRRRLEFSNAGVSSDAVLAEKNCQLECATSRICSGSKDSVEVNELKDELLRQRALNKKLKDDHSEMQNKILGLEVDLFNKITSTVKLEHENLDLKSSCATLEKEREELQLQLTDFESEITLLKLRLEKSQTNDSGPSTNDDTEEDKKLLSCVLKAEIYDKECAVKSKLSKALSQIKEFDSKDKDSVASIQLYLKELQTDVDELIVKRNELEHSSKTAHTSSTNAEDKIKEDIFNLMEADLQCSICNEVFIKATSLSCSHTFCKMCIQRWQKQKNTCPVCRVPIKTSAHCIALDNYIDQTMDLLSPSKKELRAKLKESHEATASSSDGPTNTTRSGRIMTIYVSSDDSDSDTDLDTEDYSEYSDTYYGGYGSCFICGDPGHWANGCPHRNRR